MSDTPAPATTIHEEDNAKKKKKTLKYKVPQAVLDYLVAHPPNPVFVGPRLDVMPAGEKRDSLAAGGEALRKVHAELTDMLAQYKATGEAYVVMDDDDDHLPRVSAADVRSALQMVDDMFDVIDSYSAPPPPPPSDDMLDQ
uniref:Uncharacterized protein n=1 Tax=Oryza glumipatula TaxID=40148 RepID=A0A0E0AJK0_9ORYZ